MTVTLHKSLLLVMTLTCIVACNKQSATATSDDHANDSISVQSEDFVYKDYQEPEWYEEDGTTGTLQTMCDLDDWLHGTQQQKANPLTRKLLDAYNSSVVWHDIEHDLQLYFRFGDQLTDENDELAPFTTYEAIEQLDCSIISDTEISSQARKLKQYAIILQKDTTQTQYFDYRDTYIGNSVEKFHVSNFGDISEDEYWEMVNPVNWVEDYDSISDKRMSGDSIYQAFLVKQLHEEKDINRRCVYAIEYAHSSTDGPHFQDAKPYLIQIMTDNKYSPLLKDVWRTWRAIQSAEMGMSKDSSIPNFEYNRLRNRCAQTILNHIENHPDDILAIDIFLVLGFCDNINRYGGFAFGNQSVMDQMEVFPEYFAHIFEHE